MYLYQIDNKLIVSETKRPERGIYKIGHELYHALSEWQKNLIPVKEGEEKRFYELIISLLNETSVGSIYRDAPINEILKNGIKLADEAVRIEIACKDCGRNKEKEGYCSLDCPSQTFAHLNSQPKKEESNEAIDWQEVIEKRIKHFNNNYHTHEAKELQLALSTIRRLVPPISFKI